MKHILGQNEAEELLRNIADDVSLSGDELNISGTFKIVLVC
jgi:hypothetical protein